MSIHDVGRDLLASVRTLSNKELMLCIDVLYVALLDDDDEQAMALLKAAMAENSARNQGRTSGGRATMGFPLEMRTKH